MFFLAWLALHCGMHNQLNCCPPTMANKNKLASFVAGGGGL